MSASRLSHNNPPKVVILQTFSTNKRIIFDRRLIALQSGEKKHIRGNFITEEEQTGSINISSTTLECETISNKKSKLALYQQQ